MTKPDNGRVLIAVDGSRNSMIAAGVGARMAQLLGMRVGLVHVLDIPVVSFWVGVETRLKDDIRAQAKATLTDVSEMIQRTCHVTPEVLIFDGETADEIEKFVRANPDIVMVVTGCNGVGSEKRTELMHDGASHHLGARLASRLPVAVVLVPPDAPESMICKALSEFRRKSET
ncbi:MAG: universal stress protein [Gammaproteobacteria bacterium]